MNRREFIKGSATFFVGAAMPLPALALPSAPDYASLMPVGNEKTLLLRNLPASVAGHIRNHLSPCRNMASMTKDEFNYSITPDSVAFYDEVPADSKGRYYDLVFRCNRGENAIALATRRGRGIYYAFMDDHILIYYRNRANSNVYEDGPCSVINGRCVVNDNYTKYFSIIKTDMTSEGVYRLRQRVING